MKNFKLRYFFFKFVFFNCDGIILLADDYCLSAIRLLSFCGDDLLLNLVDDFHSFKTEINDNNNKKQQIDRQKAAQSAATTTIREPRYHIFSSFCIYSSSLSIIWIK